MLKARDPSLCPTVVVKGRDIVGDVRRSMELWVGCVAGARSRRTATATNWRVLDSRRIVRHQLHRLFCSSSRLKLFRILRNDANPRLVATNAVYRKITEKAAQVCASVRVQPRAAASL